MLVLSRCVQEELLIDENIRLVVLGVQGQRVKLGITAPDDVSIHRGEIEIVLAGDQTQASRSNWEDVAVA